MDSPLEQLFAGFAQRAPGPGTDDELDNVLSTPRQATMHALARVPGNIVVLGAGGKMGPTLARMAKRAAPERRVIAVSRFASAGAETALRAAGVETLRCDLLNQVAVAALPDADNVVFMAGQKFGTAQDPARTKAANVEVPSICAARYANARIVAFSTGNVYPLVPVTSSGARETGPTGPIGHYAETCLERERVFAHASATHGTRVAIVRLNYAIALRYGVLTDLAVKVRDGIPIPVEMGSVNVIWQGDASRAALELFPLAASPPLVVNVTGTAAHSVRWLASECGKRLGKTPKFTGTEAPDALLSDASRMRALLGEPEIDIQSMLDQVVYWLKQGAPLLDGTTKFEERHGTF